jgi:hypothetical protein
MNVIPQQSSLRYYDFTTTSVSSKKLLRESRWHFRGASVLALDYCTTNGREKSDLS